MQRQGPGQGEERHSGPGLQMVGEASGSRDAAGNNKKAMESRQVLVMVARVALSAAAVTEVAGEGTWTGCLLAMETREGKVAVAVPKGAADPLNCNNIIFLSCNIILVLQSGESAVSLFLFITTVPITSSFITSVLIPSLYRTTVGGGIWRRTIIKGLR